MLRKLAEALLVEQAHSDPERYGFELPDALSGRSVHADQRKENPERAASPRLTPTAMVFRPPLQEKRYRQRSSSTMWSFSMTIFRLDSSNAATAAMRKSTTGRSTSLRCAASRELLSIPASFARCRTAGRAFCRRARAKNERARSSCCTKLFRTAMRSCARTRWRWLERTGAPMQTACLPAIHFLLLPGVDAANFWGDLLRHFSLDEHNRLESNEFYLRFSFMVAYRHLLTNVQILHTFFIT